MEHSIKTLERELKTRKFMLENCLPAFEEEFKSIVEDLELDLHNLRILDKPIKQ